MRAAIGLALVFCAAPWLTAPPARALVFASPETEPRETIPPDFPYWENVTQRRYDSPSVVYLGNGFALTARHVGPGEIFLRGEIVPPVAGSRRTLLNPNGTPADAMLFEVELPEGFEDLPALPLAKTPPAVGDEVLLIGFGRVREKVVEVSTDGPNEFGFSWSEKGQKRWGTNRISSLDENLYQGSWSTRAIATVFDPPGSPEATDHEAQATVGDSGGAVFVKREGEWLLAGMMTSVTGYTRHPARTSMYGDMTYAADLSVYRAEILHWARPACSNEEDDDGDERIDFAEDPGCDSALDTSERDRGLPAAEWPWIAFAVLVAIAGFATAWRRRRSPPA
ncbi:MAG: hypothetical protein U0900_17410 [Myxococcota bacterium]